MNGRSKKALDLTSQRYGLLTLQTLVGKNANRQTIWRALCDCGNITEVLATKVRTGHTTSCGCQARNLAVPMVGRVCGRLTVMRFAGTGAGRHKQWVCRCVCGIEVTVSGAKLRNGHTSSCGCLSIENAGKLNLTHGQAGRQRTRAYRAWKAMWARCTQEGVEGAKNYILRGITVCSRWESFPKFYQDMGECPAGLTLERRNVDGNYEPGNCEWATYETQANNRRSSVKYLIEGLPRSLAQAARHWETSPRRARTRILTGDYVCVTPTKPREIL